MVVACEGLLDFLTLNESIMLMISQKKWRILSGRFFEKSALAPDPALVKSSVSKSSSRRFVFVFQEGDAQLKNSPLPASLSQVSPKLHVRYDIKRRELFLARSLSLVFSPNLMRSQKEEPYTAEIAR